MKHSNIGDVLVKEFSDVSLIRAAKHLRGGPALKVWRDELVEPLTDLDRAALVQLLKAQGFCEPRSSPGACV